MSSDFTFHELSHLASILCILQIVLAEVWHLPLSAGNDIVATPETDLVDGHGCGAAILSCAIGQLRRGSQIIIHQVQPNRGNAVVGYSGDTLRVHQCVIHLLLR